MKKKKIVVTAAQVPFVKGGAELLNKYLCINLEKRGYDVEIVAIPFKWYPENTLYDNLMAWRLLDLDESNGEKIDLIISTKFPSYGVKHPNKVTWLVHQFRQAYDLFGTEVGLQNIENGEKIRLRVKNFDNKCLTESKKIYTISKNVTKRLEKYNRIASEPLYHPPALVGRYFCEEYGDYILSVGRLDKLKRNELLIQALRYCDKNVKAVIAGKGPEMELLRKAAQRFGVSDRVEFPGFVSDEDLLKLYSRAFAIFYAPLDEDYGYITLEAFLSKKPVITCADSGGVLEFVEDDLNGFVSTPVPEELGMKINKLYNHKQSCLEFGNAGYLKVKDITWDDVIDKLTCTLR